MKFVTEEGVNVRTSMHCNYRSGFFTNENVVINLLCPPLIIFKMVQFSSDCKETFKQSKHLLKVQSVPVAQTILSFGPKTLKFW